ncbi:MAG TPA: hypothetical protein VK438_06385 [Xanthobacteraceae bacterium]|nr:hypothetical protein [Xanthobacteraceae bacterium]
MVTASTTTSKPTNGTTPADIEKQLETIRDDIAQLTKQMADLIGQAKDDAMAQVKGQARRARAQADAMLSDAKETGREAIDALHDVADTFGDAMEDSLKRRPYATLAVVAGIGFLLGTAWRR